MRVTVKLTEMKEAEAQFVSLVTRGANRIPFRIVKSAQEDKNMIDLSNPMKIFKGEKKPEPKVDAQPVISAVVLSADVQKSDKLEAIKAALAEQGFQVEKSEVQEDGSLMFPQVENPLEEGEVIRMDENMLMVIKGFCPYSADLKGFAEILGAEGYYDGLRTATYALQTAMGQAMQSADSPVEAAQKAEQVLNDFKVYVSTLVKNLPEKAFKADAAVHAVMAAEVAKTEAPADTGTGDGITAEEVEKAGMACPEGMKKEEWDAMSDDAKKTYLAKKAEGSEDESASDEEKVVRKAADTVLSVVKGELTAFFGTMTEKLEGISKEQQSLATRVEEVASQAAETAKKAEDAKNVVNTTVIAGTPKGDTPAGAPQVIEKAESDPRTGCFDTAFIRKSTR